MNRSITALLIILAVLCGLGSFGCGSTASNPMLPSEDGLSSGRHGAQESGATVLGVYDLAFDEDSLSLQVAESRSGTAHYDISPYLGPHVTATLVSWDPVTRILVFDLSMTNPSALYVFDVRTLLITDSGSGWELLNPDDYTKLFNPYAPDHVNAFRAYAKTMPDRVFGSGATHSEPFHVQCPPAWGPAAKLLVECSWPTNCEDVYEISNQSLSNPISDTTHGTITLNAYDHQDNVGAVYVDTTPITGGLTWLTNIGGTTWTGGLHNSAGAAPGIYKCRITADSWASAENLYDFIDIEVISSTPPPGWSWVDYPIPTDLCSMDLGVIADPGGPRDSQILMVNTGMEPCDTIVKHDAYYTANTSWVGLYDYDPANNTYQPYPVLRLDAADDGAFSFTNGNSLPYSVGAAGAPTVYNHQIWSVFDNAPKLHLGPTPDEGRYFFDLTKYDVISKPADVCDDFTLGQYALFTTRETYSPEDLIFLGTQPSSYTYDKVRYKANLDGWVGFGPGLLNPAGILGIDVVEYVDKDEKQIYARLYVLEDSGSHYQIEVFNIFDTSSGWGGDFVSHLMTIDISYLVNLEMPGVGCDLEILPVNDHYKLNPTNPTVCVLFSWSSWGKDHGEVLLYDALTGGFLESIGDMANPAMPESKVQFLDTDDDDWEIHVTRIDAAGNTLATVFSYN